MDVMQEPQPVDGDIVREMALIHVRVPPSGRPEVLALCSIFRVSVLHVGPESFIVQAVGKPGKLEALIETLEPFGILHMVRTGPLTLPRCPRSGPAAGR